jgi:hypothetical protein
LPSTATVLDLGAGTGKLTRPAVAAVRGDRRRRCSVRERPTTSTTSIPLDIPFEPFRTTALENPQGLDRDRLVAFYASMG